MPPKRVTGKLFVKDDVSTLVLASIVEHFPIPRVSFALDTFFKDLGGTIRELRSVADDCIREFDIEITEDDLKIMKTVGDFIALVEAKLKAERRLVCAEAESEPTAPKPTRMVKRRQ